MKSTQNTSVAAARAVSLMSSGRNQGFSIQNKTIAATIPRPVTYRR